MIQTQVKSRSIQVLALVALRHASQRSLKTQPQPVGTVEVGSWEQYRCGRHKEAEHVPHLAVQMASLHPTGHRCVEEGVYHVSWHHVDAVILPCWRLAPVNQRCSHTLNEVSSPSHEPTRHATALTSKTNHVVAKPEESRRIHQSPPSSRNMVQGLDNSLLNQPEVLIQTSLQSRSPGPSEQLNSDALRQWRPPAGWAVERSRQAGWGGRQGGGGSQNSREHLHKVD